MKLLYPIPYTLNPQSGYIALMSAIIISVLLLAITVSLGFSGFFVRLNIVDSESKERSSALAEACADQAILNFTQGSSVAVTDFLVGPDASDKCNIISVTSNGNQTTIKTQAYPNKAYTNLKVVIDSNDFSIISWDECTVLSSC